MKIAIYSQKKDLDIFLYLSRFISELDRRDIEVVIHHNTAENLQFSDKFETFQCREDLLRLGVNLFFTFGGDGTIVDSLLFLANTEIPIVGINVGRLGFLASFSKENIFSQLDEILNGDYKIRKRSIIEVVEPKGDFFPYVLNDISVSRKETTSMNTDTFVVTPIAPHNLNVRPLVVNNNVEIRLKVDSRVPQYSLSLDSRLVHMNQNVEILIRKAPFKIHLVQPKNLSFYETIRQKLLWGMDKRND